MKSNIIADKERMTKNETMEYKVVIQENLENGTIYFHIFPLDPLNFNEALTFRSLDYHSDCFFVVEYSLN